MRGMGNMQNMMKQVQKMQKQMEQAAVELGTKEFEGTAGGGMVSITLNGNKEVTKVALKPEVVDPDDIEMLQDLIIVATNEAIRKVEETSNNTMGQFTKGMNLPKGLF
jgi:DNA-binding YbaB/EbfC family protein